jgi:hypothetical protein
MGGVRSEDTLFLFYLGGDPNGGRSPTRIFKKNFLKKNERRKEKTNRLYKKGGRSPPFPSEPRAKRGASEVKDYLFLKFLYLIC